MQRSSCPLRRRLARRGRDLAASAVLVAGLFGATLAPGPLEARPATAAPGAPAALAEVAPTAGPRQAAGAALADSSSGLWVGYSDGAVEPVGSAKVHGGAGGLRLNSPIVGMARTADGGGYWLLGRDGGVFSYGNAVFHGSTGNLRLNQPVVSMASHPTQSGYWFTAADGGVFTYGNAGFHGSAGNLRLNRPVVGMAPTPTGGGYWLVASDGGIFAYGDARFSGSTGAMRLNEPIVAMAPDPDGHGYWLAAADGGIFAFDAPFHGSGAGRLAAGDRVVNVVAHPTAGYWLVTAQGSVIGFGAADGTNHTSSERLRFAPPGFPDFAGYRVVNVDSPGRHFLRLRYDTDYVIRISTKIERLAVGGGRNVVIVGGHISVPDQGSNPAPPGDRWGLWLDDTEGASGSGELVPGRVVHVEGVLIDGVDLSDAINVRGPSMVLQLQNMRTGLSGFRSAADRDGTGIYGGKWTHADSFQPHGGLRELRTDRVTMITGYQGIFTKNNSTSATAKGGSRAVTSMHPTYRLSRTNVRLESFTSRGDDPSRPQATGSARFTGHSALWIPVDAPSAQLPGRFFMDQLYVERGSENPTQLVWPRTGSQALRANGDGSYSYPSSFTHPVLGGEWVRNWGGTGPGRFLGGRPPGGDFVPGGVAGLGYRSPGYQG